MGSLSPDPSSRALRSPSVPSTAVRRPRPIPASAPTLGPTAAVRRTGDPQRSRTLGARRAHRSLAGIRPGTPRPSARRAALPRVYGLLAFLLLALIVPPESYAAERVERERLEPLESIDLTWASAPLTTQLVHDDPPVPLPEGHEGTGAPIPTAPSRLFAGVVDESACRAPVLSDDGWGRAALCELGRGTKNAAWRWVIRGAGRIEILPHRPPPAAGPHSLDFGQADGTVALLALEGGKNVVHVLDLRGRTDHSVTGPFSDPSALRLSGDGRTVDITARFGRSQAALTVPLQGSRGAVLSRGKGAGTVDLSADGRTHLVFGEGGGHRQLWLVDENASAWLDLSGSKGDAIDGALHPSADAAIFASRIGGVCAVFWVDLGLRRREEVAPGVDSCFEDVALDGTHRLAAFVAHHRPSRGPERLQTIVFDRKRKGPLLDVPERCLTPTIDATGRLLAVACASEPGPGTWILPLPEAP